MNTFSKYYPNVFLIKSENEQQKGNTIEVQTKYGKINKCIIYNLIYTKDGFFFYSYIREDGYNLQERAKAKSEKYQNWSISAQSKSTEYYKASQEGADFLRLAEPIKIGHHSENRHRALIDRNWNRMGKSVAFSEKSQEHQNKADYWEKKSNEINLSMPESLEFYQFKLKEATQKHADIKSGKIEKSHSFSLTYAKKEINELTKKVHIAQKLWK